MKAIHISDRSAFKSAKASLGLGSKGMTIIELLIAIMLFAMFMSVFVVVTEMLVAWIPATNFKLSENHCNGQGLEQSCINVSFDQMVESLELAPFEEVDTLASSVITDDCWHRPSPGGIYGDGDIEWPDSFRVCLIRDPGASETNPSAPEPSHGGKALPGLYLLQASPIDDAFWRKPVQRLFCRPIHLCVRDQSLSQEAENS